MIRVCPDPLKWLDIYDKLRSIAKERRIAPPPGPLILGGWWHSSDAQKIARWEEHVAWAKAHGAQALVDAVGDADFYYVHELTSPRDWDWSFEVIPPAVRPTDGQLGLFMKLIQENWKTLAGGFSEQTIPVSFSGPKARTLNIKLLTTEPLPPWGTWGLEKVGLHAQKFTHKVKFTVFRKSINLLITPHRVDHVDFYHLKKIPNAPKERKDS